MTRKKSSAKTEYNRARTERGCNLRIQRDRAAPAAGGVARYSSGESVTRFTGVSRVDEPAGGGFDHGFGSSGYVQLTAGVFDMEIHRAFADVQNSGDLGRSFSSRGPSEALQFSVMQRHVARPNFIARAPSQSRLDDGGENLEIDRLGDVIIGTETPTFQFAVAIRARR